MAATKQTPKRKKRPNKQKEMGAATLLRMAKSARERATTLTLVEPITQGDEYAARSLREFADIHEAEAKKLRKMR